MRSRADAATSVNLLDCKLRQHGSAAARPSCVLGADFSGVSRPRDDVQTLSTGMRYTDSVRACAAPTAAHWLSILLVDARVLARKPVLARIPEAAALPLAAITAWEGVERASVAAGQRVLVRGASGGVGHLAVQFARCRGAHVTALTSSAERAAIALDLGADVAIDSREEPLGPTIARVTDGVGYDVAFDATGRPIYPRCRRQRG